MRDVGRHREDVDHKIAVLGGVPHHRAQAGDDQQHDQAGRQFQREFRPSR
ncbi:MAG: hypothetical protein WDN03_00610 [Rhizomicrobium sp.]